MSHKRNVFTLKDIVYGRFGQVKFSRRFSFRKYRLFFRFLEKGL